MPDSPPSKAGLRKEMRRMRQALSPAAQRLAADGVCHHITRLPNWATARRIALYLASDGEIGTAPLARLCRAAGIQLYLPVIGEKQTLEFAHWAQHETLIPNRYGIPEPGAAATRCAAGTMDILVLPLVAWDASGARLGMGGGYYDRTLASVRGSPTLVGLAHSTQQLPELPRDDWDVALDFVVTESALHCCRG